MSYIGAKELKASDIRRFDVTGSTSATHTLTWSAPTEQSLIVTINGVKQHEDAYSVSGTTLTLTSALVSTDKLEVIGINDIGTTITPAEGSVTNDHISTSAAIAQSKLSLDITNSDVNASAAISLSKLATDPSNASNLASGTVPTARLGSGTASSSTFLRGDQSWAEAGGGKILQVVVAEAAEQTSYINSTSWSDTGGMSVSITPSSASNNIIIHVSDTVYIGADGFHLYRLYETANSATICEALMGTHNGTQFGESVGLVGYYNPTNTNELTFKTYMRRLDGSAQSRMRDSQIESSSNVFRLIAMEVEG